MLRVGIVNPETWDFLRGLHAALAARFQTSVFSARTTRSPVLRERISRYQLRRDLSAFMRENDVVFFEWASELLVLATHLPKTCVIIARLHRYELYQWAKQVNWAAVDHVILVSEAKRRELLAMVPMDPARTHVIYGGVSTRTFADPRRPTGNTVGTLCHLTPRKRVYELILSFAEMVKQRPSLRLRIAGDRHPAYGDYHSAMLCLVDRLGLRDAVTFEGFLERPWEWYPGVDVFVSNSYSEGLQVAALEAMASGCFTLSHVWDGADELLPDQCLFVTGSELVDKVLSFFARSEEAQRAARAELRGRVVERFDEDLVNAAVIDLISRSALERDTQTRRPDQRV